MTAERVREESVSAGGLLRMGLLGGTREKKTGIRDKVTDAIRKLEMHKKEVQLLRKRLQERSNKIFESVILSLQVNEHDKATIYANENVEIKKIMKVLWTAELALTQVVLRLESIRDVGEAVREMDMAFGVIRSMGKVLEGMTTEMSLIQTNIQSTLTETMAELGQLSPDLQLNVQASNGDQILEEAMKYLEEQIVRQELRDASEPLPGTSQFESAKKTALLEGGDTDDESFKINLVKAPDGQLDQAVNEYLKGKPGKFDVYETAAAIGADVDEVEKSVMKLVSEGKLKLEQKGEQG